MNRVLTIVLALATLVVGLYFFYAGQRSYESSSTTVGEAMDPAAAPSYPAVAPPMDATAPPEDGPPAEGVSPSPVAPTDDAAAPADGAAPADVAAPADGAAEPTDGATAPLATPRAVEAPVRAPASRPSSSYASPSDSSFDAPTRAIAPVDDNPNAPMFPWPPPRPSSITELPRAALAGQAAQPTLGTVAARLEAALQATGYFERRYYAVPGGYALATRAEQIDDAGAPKPDAERWQALPPVLDRFDLSAWVRALFAARKGRYRIIVFIVSSTDVVPSDRPATEAQVNEWSSGGVPRLPAAIANRPFSTAHVGSALIYEFVKSDVGAEVVHPGIAARTQLERAGLWAVLTR